MKVLDLEDGQYKDYVYSYRNSDGKPQFEVTFDKKNIFSYSASENSILVSYGISDTSYDATMTVTWLGTGKEISFEANKLQRTYKVHWDNLREGVVAINFDSQGGSYVEPISAEIGKKATAPTPPTCTKTSNTAPRCR